jgi:ectoine hydroxylase-related dioxygenase (phytanoyl-CoA dioxygenase family)
MDMATALADLGVAPDSIDAETRSRLDRDGYAALPGALSAGQLAVMRTRLGEQLAAEGDRAGLEVHQEAGTDRLADLVNPALFSVCNSIWLLDDFTADNGATRVVPGSHLSGKSPEDVMADRRDACPGEVLLVAPAGTVVVFNSHLWHGGTLNRSSRHRRALHAYFTRRGYDQQLDQRKYVRPETLARLGPAARFILDV